MKTISNRFFVLIILCLSVFMASRSGFSQAVVTAAQVNGTWRSTTSKPSRVTEEFWIWALGNQKLTVEFSANNPVKRFSNTATDTAMIEGTTVLFRPHDNQLDESKPCIMTLNFSATKLVVTEKGECGWGAGIGSAGTYRKVSSKKPKFDEP